ncbi:hypothetical protein ACO22_05733 [Paracoccidioides brasiliensis]|uniref:Large ribosomal subunit protein mL67 n=1 Tax=Paracoccidioides brasiliensis TaxID=121759 RepID=A0A1D2J9G9_PARBR|nr:hypothetical protein ACO22_05733 [Paracoccidioides brasiliensis]
MVAKSAVTSAARIAAIATRGAEVGAGVGVCSEKRLVKVSSSDSSTSEIPPPPPKETVHVNPSIVSTWNVVRFPKSTEPIQGRVREPTSRAALLWRAQEVARLRKALNRMTHGKNIFAYNNIRTNQVIYSFTRALEKNKVLSQLIYHGKKTVPATLRKDMWTPYFSVHFPSATLGLETYRLLREFSIQRQLAPPTDIITASKDNEVLTRQRPRDPKKAEEWDEQWNPRMEQRQILNKRLRARVLMDQKATSVADIAAVLALQEQKLKAQEEQEAREAEQEDGNGAGEKEGERKVVSGTKGVIEKDGVKRDSKGRKVSRKRLARIRAAIRKEQRLEKETMDKIAKLERKIWSPTATYKIDPDVPPTEHHIVNDGEIKIFWMDVHNLQYAESWPKNVVHGQLKITGDHIMGVDLDLEGPVLAEFETAPAARVEEGAGKGEGEGEGRAEAGGEEENGEPPKEEKSGLKKLKFW